MSPLDQLCERCGIQAEFEDAYGEKHVVSAETKRALLKAMRLAADTDEQAAESLRELNAEEMGRALPPVCVVYRDGRPLTVRVAVDPHVSEIRWTVRCEEGDEMSGVADAQELVLTRKGECSEGGIREIRTLSLPQDLPFGYHSLRIEGWAEECSLIISPGQCWVPPEAIGGGKLWGFATQLYSVRSAHNWGMGDFTDLRRLMETAERSGADAVGVNPLHAMFPDKPEEASPYSPSDRLLLNFIYIDVERVPELASSKEARDLLASPEFQQKLKASRDADLVDYAAVTALKLPVLKLLFATFEQNADPERTARFEAFHAQRRALLDRACLFQALRAHFTEDSPEKADCGQWPEGFRCPSSPDAERFAKEHPDLVRFQLWLQWLADEQLAGATAAARRMSIGLYRDLAVGASPSGAEVWTFPEALVSGASIGAPPDLWNPAGQNWGLPPLHPIGSRNNGYRNFIELLQANMRHAGALRIDHALALQRLYWIPEGNAAKEGTYVLNPMEDLIGILALESHRNRCLVIGEDLGTVPEGFRERMAEANILSYRLLLFERNEDGFVSPQDYPRLSLSVASSHDLPTLRGWWQGSDIELKENVHVFPSEDDARKARETRERDRAAVLDALVREGLLREHQAVGLQDFLVAIHAYLARTRSLLTLVQLDDMTEEEVQVNIPGSTDQNPNWRRKLRLSLEQMDRAGLFETLGGLMEAQSAIRQGKREQL